MPKFESTTYVSEVTIIQVVEIVYPDTTIPITYTRLSQVTITESATESPNTSSLTSTGDTSPRIYSSSATTKSADPPQSLTTTTSPTRKFTRTAKLASSAGTGGSLTVGESEPQSEPVKSQILSRSNRIMIAVILGVVGLLIILFVFLHGHNWLWRRRKRPAEWLRGYIKLRQKPRPFDPMSDSRQWSDTSFGLPLEAALPPHAEFPAVDRKVAGEFVVHAPDELPCGREIEGFGAGDQKASNATDVRIGQPLEELCQRYHSSKKSSNGAGG